MKHSYYLLRFCLLFSWAVSNYLQLQAQSFVPSTLNLNGVFVTGFSFGTITLNIPPGSMAPNQPFQVVITESNFNGISNNFEISNDDGSS
ncbi:MAG: hypothetical protein NZ108_03680, partial [Bacteroidia bacterium]|nr:hypothetical protein [Bacteroidia bacterium]